MSRWEALSVTGVGRPVLSHKERELAVQNSVGIYEGKYKAQEYQDGRIYLTTHRICYVDNQHPRTHSMHLRLSIIDNLEHYGGFLKSSAKITLFLKPREAGDDGDNDAGGEGLEHIAHLHITLMATWVCPICYYSNEIVPNYLQIYADLPVCKTCGIKATREIVESSLSAFNNANAQHSGTGNAADGSRCPRCTFINHPSLSTCEMCGARLTSAMLPPSLAGPCASASDLIAKPKQLAMTNSDIKDVDFNMVKLSFHAGGDRAFYELLKKTLKEKPWLDDTKQTLSGKLASQQEQRPSTPTTGLGLHSLELINSQQKQRNQEVLGSALEDLQTLMARAKDVVELAESYAKRLEVADLKSSSTSSYSENVGTTAAAAAARKALRESSEALGLNSSVVTKEMAQTNQAFHEELARQLADFLSSSGLLQREGGTITLVDAFAYYNRARGISLISPKDLRAACDLLETLKLPIRVRKFRSGLLVIQEGYRTPNVIIRELLAWFDKLEVWQKEAGVSVEQVSAKFRWSPIVTTEELDMAEYAGAICRDAQVSGVRFFPNLIRPYAAI